MAEPQSVAEESRDARTAIACLVAVPGALEIAWGDGHLSRFHHIWLRDNCACPACLHPETRERILDTAAIPPDIAAEEAVLQADGRLAVRWADDGHESVYEAAWLRAHCYSARARDERRHRPVPWDGRLAENLPSASYDAVMADDRAFYDWLCLVRDYGLARLVDVPLAAGEVARFAGRIARPRDTNFGRLFDVVSMPDPNNIAYTALALRAHTDLPNREMPPGIQFLHCLVSEAEGGASLLVDGFAAAERLRAQAPEAFALLTRIGLPFRFHDADNDLRYTVPTFRLDETGAVAEVRYHNALTAPSRSRRGRSSPSTRHTGPSPRRCARPSWCWSCALPPAI